MDIIEKIPTAVNNSVFESYVDYNYTNFRKERKDNLAKKASTAIIIVGCISSPINYSKKTWRKHYL